MTLRFKAEHMATDETIRIKIRADTADADRKLDDITKRLRKAGREGRGSMGVLNKASKALGEGLQNLKQNGMEAFEGLRHGANVAGGALGELGGQADDAIQAIVKLGGAFGPAASAALAATALFAGFAAAGASAALAANDLREELDEMGRTPVITPQQQASLDDMDASIAELSASTKEFVVVLGAEFAPTLRDVADGLDTIVDWGRTLIGVWSDLKDGSLLVAKYLNPIYLAGQAFNATFGESAEVVEEFGESSQSATDWLDAFEASFSDLTSDDKPAKLKGLSTGVKEVSYELETLAGTMGMVSGEGGSIFAQKMEYMATTTGKLQIAALAARDTMMTLFAEQGELIATASEAMEEHGATFERVNQGKVQSSLAAASAIANTTAQLTGTLLANMKTRTIEQRKEARKMFAVHKGVSLGQAVISGALAFTNALATPPAPLGIVLAALTAALSAAQIGIIAAQQPQFHIGSRSTGNQPDEVSATLRTGERVVTPAGVEELTKTVTDANAGVGGGGGQIAYVVIDNAAAGKISEMQLRPGSRLNKAIRQGEPRGHSRKRGVR